MASGSAPDEWVDAVRQACFTGDASSLAELLPPNARAVTQRYPLLEWACRSGDGETVRIVVNAGAPLDAPDGVGGTSVLHALAELGDGALDAFNCAALALGPAAAAAMLNDTSNVDEITALDAAGRALGSSTLVAQRIVALGGRSSAPLVAARAAAAARAERLERRRSKACREALATLAVSPIGRLLTMATRQPGYMDGAWAEASAARRIVAATLIASHARGHAARLAFARGLQAALRSERAARALSTRGDATYKIALRGRFGANREEYTLRRARDRVPRGTPAPAPQRAPSRKLVFTRGATVDSDAARAVEEEWRRQVRIDRATAGVHRPKFS